MKNIKRNCKYIRKYKTTFFRSEKRNYT